MERVEEAGPVRVEHLEGGAFRRVVMNAPRANLLDGPMVRALGEVFAEAARDRNLKVLSLEGEGAHFSFGASIEEHLPGRAEAMLAAFHGLFRAMLNTPVVCLAVVRGRCLGGGLELATFCQRVFAEPGALLGQPEITLGVFAPVASVFLAERVGRPAAEDLCLSGRVIDAPDALRIGLIDEIADDPFQAALTYAGDHLLPRSAAGLRHAVMALRRGLRRRFLSELDEVERLYLDSLMSTRDAQEGLRAFLEKRPPAWTNE